MECHLKLIYNPFKTARNYNSCFVLDSENFESGTPDSSFLTPLNPNRTRRTERTREILRTKDNSNLRVRTDVRRRHANSWFEGGSRENIRVGNEVRRTGRESIHGEPGFRRIELRGEERLIKQPTDSDFEEFNISRNESQLLFVLHQNLETFCFVKLYCCPWVGGGGKLYKDVILLKPGFLVNPGTYGCMIVTH